METPFSAMHSPERLCDDVSSQSTSSLSSDLDLDTCSSNIHADDSAAAPPLLSDFTSDLDKLLGADQDSNQPPPQEADDVSPYMLSARITELEERRSALTEELKRLKELQRQIEMKQKSKELEGGDRTRLLLLQDFARKKKVARAQRGFLRHLLKLADLCRAKGFVYAVIPEKGIIIELVHHRSTILRRDNILMYQIRSFLLNKLSDVGVNREGHDRSV